MATLGVTKRSPSTLFTYLSLVYNLCSCTTQLMDSWRVLIFLLLSWVNALRPLDHGHCWAKGVFAAQMVEGVDTIKRGQPKGENLLRVGKLLCV